MRVDNVKDTERELLMREWMLPSDNRSSRKKSDPPKGLGGLLLKVKWNAREGKSVED
jgi:hypothetical protein